MSTGAGWFYTCRLLTSTEAYWAKRATCMVNHDVSLDLEKYFGTFPTAISSQYTHRRYSKPARKRRRWSRALFNSKLKQLVGGLFSPGKERVILFNSSKVIPSRPGFFICSWRDWNTIKSCFDIFIGFELCCSENRHVYELLCSLASISIIQQRNHVITARVEIHFVTIRWLR